ncbi:MAG: hypothetical protein EOO04_05025 [Chitinophagaceae bacterium]|nr:MAG: hypothetical protein EOO04_05025 [Chitinophagaceae bacterium]
MNKVLLGMFVGLLICCHAAAQNEIRVIKGYLGVEGGESFSYMLKFTDSAGIIKGSALCWQVEGKEVRADIEGVINKKDRTLSFTETKIRENKGFSSNQTICLISAVLRFTKVDESLVFSGSITSKDAGNVYCGTGTITFQDNEEVRALFKELPATALPAPPVPVAKATKPMKVVYDTARKLAAVVSSPVQKNALVEQITTGKDKTIEWSSDSLVIEIWDNSQPDGDRISLSFNDQLLIPEYTLIRDKKIFQIALSTLPATIRIKALNEGSQSPNTADLILRDGRVIHRLLAYNDVGKFSTIRIVKKTIDKKP